MIIINTLIKWSNGGRGIRGTAYKQLFLLLIVRNHVVPVNPLFDDYFKTLISLIMAQ